MLRKQYKSLLPMRTNRANYAALKQTGSVKEFIRELVKVRHALNDTPLAISEGDLMCHFLANLKPAFKAHLENNAPQDWYQNAQAMFDKALHFEVNLSGASSSKTSAQTEVKMNAAGKLNNLQAKQDSLKRRRQRRQAPSSGQFDMMSSNSSNPLTMLMPFMAQMQQMQQPQRRRRARVPAELWQQRTDAGECGYCGKNNHTYKDCFHKYQKN